MKKHLLICAVLMGIVIISAGVLGRINTDAEQIERADAKTQQIVTEPLSLTTPTEERSIKLSVTPEGLYVPNTITVPLGTKIKIEGDPLTLVGGMDTVIIDGYGVKKKITTEDNIIEFIADQTGTFKIYCENGMGNGTLEVQ